jgi:hypothetical protein
MFALFTRRSICPSFWLQIELLVVLKYHQFHPAGLHLLANSFFSANFKTVGALSRFCIVAYVIKLFSAKVKEVSSPIPLELPVTIAIFFADMVSSICL